MGFLTGNAPIALDVGMSNRNSLRTIFTVACGSPIKDSLVMGPCCDSISAPNDNSHSSRPGPMNAMSVDNTVCSIGTVGGCTVPTNWLVESFGIACVMVISLENELPMPLFLKAMVTET